MKKIVSALGLLVALSLGAIAWTHARIPAASVAAPARS